MPDKPEQDSSMVPLQCLVFKIVNMSYLSWHFSLIRWVNFFPKASLWKTRTSSNVMQKCNKIKEHKYHPHKIKSYGLYFQRGTKYLIFTFVSELPGNRGVLILNQFVLQNSRIMIKQHVPCISV